MTPDNAFYAFSSISLAAILLAFIIGFRDVHPSDIRYLLQLLTPASWGARRELKHQRLVRKTKIADEAMQARARGEHFVPPSDYRGR
ncbi:MAG: hypothetical protein AAFX04_12895 [Pseudomonadota bacterium]